VHAPLPLPLPLRGKYLGGLVNNGYCTTQLLDRALAFRRVCTKLTMLVDSLEGTAAPIPFPIYPSPVFSRGDGTVATIFGSRRRLTSRFLRNRSRFDVTTTRARHCRVACSWCFLTGAGEALCSIVSQRAEARRLVESGRQDDDCGGGSVDGIAARRFDRSA